MSSTNFPVFPPSSPTFSSATLPHSLPQLPIHPSMRAWGHPSYSGPQTRNAIPPPHLPFLNSTQPHPRHEHQASTPSLSTHDYTTLLTQVHNLSSLITELQTNKSHQDELIIQHRIRIAVLENELAAAKKDKSEVLRSLGRVVTSLTQTGSHPPSSSIQPGLKQVEDGIPKKVSFAGSSEELEREIERLRRENRGLRARVRLPDDERGREIVGNCNAVYENLGEADETSRSRGLGIEGSFDTAQTEEAAITGRVGASSSAWGASSEKIHAHRATQNNSHYASSSHLGSGQKDEVSHSQQIDAPSSVWGTHSQGISNLSHALLNKQPQPTTENTPPTTPAKKNNSDVGLHSLEDYLDDFPTSLQPSPVSDSSFSAPVSSIQSPGTETPQEEKVEMFDDPRTIEEQLADSDKSLTTLAAIPTPSVLKVGFTTTGSFQGREYDPEKISLEQSLQPPRAPTQFQRPLYREKFTPQSPGSQTFDSRLWSSPEERNRALDSHVDLCRNWPSETKFVLLFQHGLQFIPTKGIDNNYFRTVVISNLPADIQLRDVLSRVRGGEIFNSVLVNTVKLTGEKTALITFRREEDAEEYVDYTSIYPIFFPSTTPTASGNLPSIPQVAETTLLSTPTYPTSSRLTSKPYQTRHLSITSFPTHLPIRYLLQTIPRKSSLLEVYLDSESNLHLEFSGIEAAACVFRHLKSNRSPWKDLLVLWGRDDCAGDIEELADSVVVGGSKGVISEERLDGLPRGADKRMDNGMNDPGFVVGITAHVAREDKKNSDVKDKGEKGSEVSTDSDLSSRNSSLKVEYDGIDKLKEEDQHQEPKTQAPTSPEVTTSNASISIPPLEVTTILHPEIQDHQPTTLPAPPNSPHLPLKTSPPTNDIANQLIQRISQIDNKNLSNKLGGLSSSKYATPVTSPSTPTPTPVSTSLPKGFRISSFGPSSDRIGGQEERAIDTGEEMRRQMDVSRRVPKVDLGGLVSVDSDEEDVVVDEGKGKGEKKKVGGSGSGGGENPDEIELDDEDEDVYDGGDEIEDVEELTGRERLWSVGV